MLGAPASCIAIVIVALVTTGCREVEQGSSSNARAEMHTRICQLTELFPGSAAQPADLAQKATALFASLRNIDPADRDLVLRLNAVAESARNLQEIKEKVGPQFATSPAGEAVVRRLEADEVEFSKSCVG